MRPLTLSMTVLAGHLLANVGAEGTQMRGWLSLRAANVSASSIQTAGGCPERPATYAAMSGQMSNSARWSALGIAKQFGHAPIAREVLSWRAYEEPGWHYESRKNVLAVGACPKCFAIQLIVLHQDADPRASRNVTWQHTPRLGVAQSHCTWQVMSHH